MRRLNFDLPDVPLTFREAGRDVGRITAWIAAGRAQGVFRPGPRPTSKSVLEFQDRLRSDRDAYECYHIELGGRSVGYFDIAARGRVGEVLGLYVVPSERGKGIGRMAVWYAIARLRQLGRTRVRAEVYRGNTPSLRMCRRAGFHPVRTIRRRADPEPVVVLSRVLDAWDPVGRVAPAYSALRGENWYLYHAALADALCSEIQRQPGIEAVLGLGSLFRQFGDEWSDLDLAVLARGPVVDALWRGERWFAGVSVDLFVIDLDAMPPSSWDPTRRQAFEESVVMYAREPGLSRRLAQTLRLRRGERRIGTSNLLFKLGWLGFAPRSWFNKERFGYLWSLPNDVWARRGCVASAHTTVDRSLDLLFELLFLLNGRLVPDPKWRRFLVASLPFLPRSFEKRVRAVEQASRDASGYAPRANELVRLVEDSCELVEREGLLADDAYRQFLRKFPDYDPRS